MGCERHRHINSHGKNASQNSWLGMLSYTLYSSSSPSFAFSGLQEGVSVLRPNECVFAKVGKAIVFLAAAKKSISNEIIFSIYLTTNGPVPAPSPRLLSPQQLYERLLGSTRSTVHGYAIYHARSQL